MCTPKLPHRLLLMLFLAGCAARPAATATPAKPAAVRPGPTHPSTLFDLIPADTSLVVRLDVQRLLASRPWQRYGPALLAIPEVAQTIELLRQGCDLDLPGDLREVDLAFRADWDRQGTLLLVRGDLSQEKVSRCLRVLFEAIGQAQPTFVRHDQMTELSDGQGAHLYLGWPAQDTMVINIAALSGDASALAWMAHPASAPESHIGSLRSMLKPGQLLSSLMLVDGRLAQGMMAGEAHPLAMWLNVTQERGLNAELVLRFARPEEAQRLIVATRALLERFRDHPLVASFGNDLAMMVHGRDAYVTLAIEEPRVDELIDGVAAQLPSWP